MVREILLHQSNIELVVDQVVKKLIIDNSIYWSFINNENVCLGL